MTNSRIILLLLLCSAIEIQSRLSVYEPLPLIDKFPGNSIEYQIGAFGEIPTGKKIIGTVVLAQPMNACDPIDLVQAQGIQDSPFVIVERGICTYVQKVRHVQAVGGKLAIIIDNLQESTFTMADDGYGYAVEIPAIIIKRHDGTILKDFIKNSAATMSQVKLIMKFEDFDKKTLHLSLFLDVHNLATSYMFIKKLSERIINLKIDLSQQQPQEFEPFYKLMVQNIDPDYITETGKDTFPDCYYNGNFCARHRFELDEIIYEKCIYKLNITQWWLYMIQFSNYWEKSHVIDFPYEKVRNETIAKLNINTGKLNKCYNESFVENSNLAIYNKKNMLLENEKVNFHTYNVTYVPAVAINHRVFHRAKNFKETPKDEDDYINHVIFSICEISPNPTEQCQVYMSERAQVEQQFYQDEFTGWDDEEDDAPPSHSIGIIVGIICFLLIIFLVFAYLFRRAIINQYNEQNKHLDQKVSEYIQLHQDSQKHIEAL